MKLKTIISVAAFVMSSLISIHSQQLSDANIIGHVIEKGTGEHLPGFTITGRCHGQQERGKTPQQFVSNQRHKRTDV